MRWLDIFSQLIQHLGRRFVQQLEKHGVRPAEAADVDAYPAVMRVSDDRVTTLYFSRMVWSRRKFSRTMREKFLRDPIGILVISVAAQALRVPELNGRPAVGKIPLGAGLLHAHRQAAGLLEKREIFLHGLGLLFGCQADPQRIKRGGIFVGGVLAAS